MHGRSLGYVESDLGRGRYLRRARRAGAARVIPRPQRQRQPPLLGRFGLDGRCSFLGTTNGAATHRPNRYSREADRRKRHSRSHLTVPDLDQSGLLRQPSACSSSTKPPARRRPCQWATVAGLGATAAAFIHRRRPDHLRRRPLRRPDRRRPGALRADRSPLRDQRCQRLCRPRHRPLHRSRRLRGHAGWDLDAATRGASTGTELIPLRGFEPRFPD
jgi:hypothetical protein